MKRYQFNHPSPERCQALGINQEGLHTRFQMWLAGVSWTCEQLGKPAAFHLTLVHPFSFVVDAYDGKLLEAVKTRLEECGYEIVGPTDSPSVIP